MAADQRSSDQLDNLKVLLQVLDDALLGRNAWKRSRPLEFFFYGDVLTGASRSHLVLLLIGLLDEGAGDLVELAERGDDPDGLSAALLGGLRRHTSTPHDAINNDNKNKKNAYTELQGAEAGHNHHFLIELSAGPLQVPCVFPFQQVKENQSKPRMNSI